MTTSKVVLNNYHLKRLFEELNTKIFQDGINQKYSYLIFKNVEYLAPIYKNLIEELYDEHKEPNYAEMVREQNDLVLKYADRDEQGNVIHDQNNNPILTENIVEFNAENEKFMAKYKDIFDKIATKQEVNQKILMKTGEYDLVTLDLNEFPVTVSPFIIGLLTSN